MPFGRASAISCFFSLLAIGMAASCTSASTDSTEGAPANGTPLDSGEADSARAEENIAGNDGGETPADSAPRLDAALFPDGSDVSDASADLDSGELENDSGTTPDSGGEPTDSGPPFDSGAPFSPMALTSADVTNGGAFPLAQAGSFGCGGSDLSPALSWTQGPANTQSYAVVMRDLTVNYLHWILYNIPSNTLAIPKGVQLFQKNPAAVTGSTQAKNDSAFYGYQGPCPLAGPSTHSYEISVYALDLATLASSADAPADVLNEIAAHIQCASGCSAQLVATFTKN